MLQPTYSSPCTTRQFSGTGRASFMIFVAIGTTFLYLGNIYFYFASKVLCVVSIQTIFRWLIYRCFSIHFFDYFFCRYWRTLDQVHRLLSCPALQYSEQML